MRTFHETSEIGSALQATAKGVETFEFLTKTTLSSRKVKDNSTGSIVKNNGELKCRLDIEGIGKEVCIVRQLFQAQALAYLVGGLMGLIAHYGSVPCNPIGELAVETHIRWA